MTPPTRLYLDNAATTHPKPQSVIDAMTDYQTRIGSSPGRGSYRESLEGAEIIRRCRRRLASLFGLASPDHTVFTLNTSDALNLAIHGMAARRARLFADGKTEHRSIHFVTTQLDHNSVLRPFNALAADPLYKLAGIDVSWTCVDADPRTGLVDPADIAAAIRPDTLLVATIHASNVSGTLYPIADIGRACKAARGGAGVPLLVDAAQSAGRVPIDMDAMGIDLLAVPGHKALMGPLGTAALLIRPGLEHDIDPVRQGGTGTVSELDTHPGSMPDKFEPGSHNTLGIAGLDAALAWLADRTVERIRADELAIIEHALARIAAPGFAPGLTLLGPRDPASRVAVFTFAPESSAAADDPTHLGPHDLAAILETDFGVCARAGIHCAPRAHEAFDTTRHGGAVRLSFGPFNTPADADHALDALHEIATASHAAESTRETATA